MSGGSYNYLCLREADKAKPQGWASESGCPQSQSPNRWGIVAIALLLVACQRDPAIATDWAKVYASRTLGIANPTIECPDLRIPHSNYFPCTVVDDETGTIYAIECSGRAIDGEGCRMAPGAVPKKRRQS